MSRLAAVASTVLALAIGCASASASADTLSRPQARSAISYFVTVRDQSNAKAGRCERLARNEMRCETAEYGDCHLTPGSACGGMNQTTGVANCGMVVNIEADCSWSERLGMVYVRSGRAVAVWAPDWSASILLIPRQPFLPAPNARAPFRVRSKLST